VCYQVEANAWICRYAVACNTVFRTSSQCNCHSSSEKTCFLVISALDASLSHPVGWVGVTTLTRYGHTPVRSCAVQAHHDWQVELHQPGRTTLSRCFSKGSSSLPTQRAPTGMWPDSNWGEHVQFAIHTPCSQRTPRALAMQAHCTSAQHSLLKLQSCLRELDGAVGNDSPVPQ